ncbi:VOC family protein [Caldifermentibacillus hisashii]|uniref:VOC family protein n=1 Tax=Caldifermentibacillus hisashii TaxID=996558 RepID=A0ABU9JYQ9_9BACI|nr:MULTISPECIES: VOC family protein [Bacillaceae]MEC5270985.1 VOC family protein [Caldifermentibacillus hisashii]MED4851474.1 VOC family protein [Caldifermentibacillus hisashii]
MGEVTIKVENLQRSIEFYTTIIGLKVLTQTGEQAILTTDGKRPILNLYVPKGVVKKNRRTSGLYRLFNKRPVR